MNNKEGNVIVIILLGLTIMTQFIIAHRIITLEIPPKDFKAQVERHEKEIELLRTRWREFDR